MAKQLVISLLVLLIVCITCVISFDQETQKHKEKRSPKPQFVFGQSSKPIPEIIVPNIKLYKKVIPFPDNPRPTQTGNQKSACRVRIKHLQEKQPVFFSIGNPDSLMIPVKGNLTWATTQKNWIACPPTARKQNRISGTNRVSAEIECVSDYEFRYVHDHTSLTITEVSCDEKVTGNERTSPIPNVQCPGTFKAVGFDVPFPNNKNLFFDLYHICFDETAATPIYTRHIVIGNEIHNKCITSSRPSFKVPGFPQHLQVLSAYSQASQKERLTELFAFASDPNPRKSVDKYFSSNFLQQGHLTPDADMLFTTWQWSTYFYINVVGMWDTINNGNWKYLEESVRSHANATKKNFHIYTGGYGTLSLCSPKKHYCVDFTLSNGRIPVPKWLWKIVKSPDSNAAIALVVSNNPFDREAPICSLGDESYGWNHKIKPGTGLGIVSYCSVQDLQSIVRNIPQEALAGSILRYEKPPR